MLNEKKKKKGLSSMQEKMGMDESTDYVTPPHRGILSGSAEAGLNDSENGQDVASKVRERMTGRA